ncbi:hypothetical protein BDR06DRAFT_1002186 [Suillus hirtellus]|nr:hypothetical protein BDR06DRAFT_1002186 [Suillus hirtellus]
MGQKWTERSIIDTLRKKELLKKIKDETGAKPGTKEMMNHYTVHLNWLMASLSPEDLQEAKETADEWNSQGVPDDVKVEIVRKKGNDMIRHFSSEMWNCTGMRVFILSAWKDGESKVQVARHDYNQEFGSAESFMKSYNWKVIEPEWDAYAASVFKGNVDENPVAQKKGRQDNMYTLEIGDDGYPVIPEYVSMDLDIKKAIVQAFLTWHYRKCCGDPKVSIPWKRQEEGEEHVFEFTGWWDNDSQDIVLATNHPDEEAIGIKVKEAWPSWAIHRWIIFW